MDTTVSELGGVSRQLTSGSRPQKPKMLVVDDEPDNLDLLYRTFRRDFNVLRAESGVAALEVLAAEGEVAVIISDQRMPEMKGTEFLSKTVPQFPNTMRIILTGFTDVEDLVEAINSGQVYKYITKPWDPGELKAVVQRAAETYGLLNQRTEELLRSQAQTNLLSVIVKVAQESPSLEACLQPLAESFGKNFAADVCILQLVEGNNLMPAQGSYSAGEGGANWLSEDSLAQAAIANQTVQACLNIPADSNLSGVAHYQTGGIQAHTVIPVTFRQEVLGLLSLQWKQPAQLREDELTLMHLSAHQVALALTCTRFYRPAV